MSRIDNPQAALDALAEAKSRVEQEADQMRRFMLSTPAQGPWLTVADQYMDWLQEEEATAAPDD